MLSAAFEHNFYNVVPLSSSNYWRSAEISDDIQQLERLEVVRLACARFVLVTGPSKVTVSAGARRRWNERVPTVQV